MYKFQIYEHVSRTVHGGKIARRQVGHLVFLKTSMSKECSILKTYALGLLVHSFRLLSFCTDFTIHGSAICIVQQQVHRFSHSFKRCCPWNWEELPLLLLASNSCYWTGWPTFMGSWKLNDPPLIKGSKTDNPPFLLWPTSPTPKQFEQSLRVTFKAGCTGKLNIF